MRTLDLTPLYRSVIGVDRMANMLNSADFTEANGFPPYDIEVVDDNHYRITLALAGFTLDDLEIEQESNRLKIAGHQGEGDEDAAAGNYLYKGIAKRDFERRFQLADHVQVTGANFANGLLQIDLVREIPEAMKPKQIAIKTAEVIAN
ncbi:MAG: Hsp20 family protein [Cellvibrionales bacterium]|nr:Hsp20 family protein [Cellvibrionales bacterium]